MLSLCSSVVSFVFNVMYVVLIVSFVMISFVCGRFGYYVICLIGIGGNVCVVVSVGRCVVSVLYCFCLIVLMNVSVMCSCVGGGCCVLWVIGNVCSVLCDVVLGISVMNVWSWLLFMICVLLCVFWLLCWLMVDVVVVGCVCFICWLVVCVWVWGLCCVWILDWWCWLCVGGDSWFMWCVCICWVWGLWLGWWLLLSLCLYWLLFIWVVVVWCCWILLCWVWWCGIVVVCCVVLWWIWCCFLYMCSCWLLMRMWGRRL